MYCRKCGARNSDQAKFCRSCGAKLPELNGGAPAGPGQARRDEVPVRPRTGSRYAVPEGTERKNDPDRRKKIAIVATVSSICCIMICIVIAVLFRAVDGSEIKSTAALKKEAQNFMEYYTDSLPNGSTMSVSDVQISSDGGAIQMNCSVNTINGGREQLVYGYKSEAGIWNYIDEDANLERPGKIIEQAGAVQEEVQLKVESSAEKFEPGPGPDELEHVTEETAVDSESGDLEPEYTEEPETPNIEEIVVPGGETVPDEAETGEQPGETEGWPVEPETEEAAEIQPIEPETEGWAAETEVQPIEPETEEATEIQPIELETEAVTEIQPFEPETEVSTEIQPIEPETEAVTEIQPFEPETEAATEIQPIEPETEAATEIQPIEPETEEATEIQPFEPETEATTEIQPFEPETEAATEIQPIEPGTEGQPAEPVTEPESEAATEEPPTETEAETAEQVTEAELKDAETETEVGETAPAAEPSKTEADFIGYWVCTAIYDYQQGIWLDGAGIGDISDAYRLELSAEGTSLCVESGAVSEGSWLLNDDGVYVMYPDGAEEQMYYLEDQVIVERGDRKYCLTRTDGHIDREAFGLPGETEPAGIGETEPAGAGETEPADDTGAEMEITEAWTDIWQDEAGQEPDNGEPKETEPELDIPTPDQEENGPDMPEAETAQDDVFLGDELLGEGELDGTLSDMPETEGSEPEMTIPETEGSEPEMNIPETEAAQQETAVSEAEGAEPEMFAPETEAPIPETEPVVSAKDQLNTYLNDTVASQWGYMPAKEVYYTYTGSAASELSGYAGIVATKMIDLDGDGNEELLVSRYDTNDSGTMGVLTSVYSVQNGAVSEGGTFAKTSYAGSGSYTSEAVRVFVKGNYVGVYETADNTASIQIYSYAGGAMSWVTGATFTDGACPADVQNWLSGNGFPTNLGDVSTWGVTMVASYDAAAEALQEGASTSAAKGCFKN